MNAINFLIDTVFSIALYLIVIRLLLVFAYISFANPIVQFIDKLTGPVIRPLRKFIPNVWRIETASLLVLYILKIIHLTVLSFVYSSSIPVASLLVYSATEVIKLLLQGMFFAVLIQALLSWIQPSGPAAAILSDITDPIMQPVRKVIPPIAGMDITPIPVLIGLQFIILMFP